MSMPLEELLEIMKNLREPEGGCPWDREQTPATLKPFLVEECYEVLEAIDSGNPGAVREELGDLLFQIVFHARLAEEAGQFTMEDVISQIRDKMIRRHPHVFGDATCQTPSDVVDQWSQLKKQEGKIRDSLLEGIPGALPSLLRAQRLQERAAKVGFDWNRKEDALEQLGAELSEFRGAVLSGNPDAMEDEFGDILFMMVNTARFVGVNPEDALRRTIGKFIHRFRHIEMAAREQGRPLKDMSLEEMDELWNEAKRNEAG